MDPSAGTMAQFEPRKLQLLPQRTPTTSSNEIVSLHHDRDDHIISHDVHELLNRHQVGGCAVAFSN